MTISTRKKLWWTLLAVASGGFILFALVALQKGFPTGREVWLNAWPVGAAVGVLISLRQLRQCYEIEPSKIRGLWHLSVADLLLVSLSAGALLSAFRATHDTDFLLSWLPVTIIITTLLLAGLLFANRLGVQARTPRWLFAAGFCLGSIAALVIGGVLTTVIVMSIYEGSPSEAVSDVADVISRYAYFKIPVFSLVVCIPAGIMTYRQSRTLTERRDATAR